MPKHFSVGYGYYLVFILMINWNLHRDIQFDSKWEYSTTSVLGIVFTQWVVLKEGGSCEVFKISIVF